MKTFRSLAFVLSLAVLPAAFGAQADFYLKIPDIKGESTSRDHKEWIDLASVSGVVTTREAGSGMATGRRQYEPIVIRKRIDKATPLLAKALAGNQVFPTVQLAVSGNDCTLTNARITSITKDGDVEEITFNYEKIAIAEKPPVQSIATPAARSRTN